MRRMLIALIAVIALVLPVAWNASALFVCPDGTVTTSSCCTDAHGRSTDDHCCTVVAPSSERASVASFAHPPPALAWVATLSPPPVVVARPRWPDVAVPEARGPPALGPPIFLKTRSMLL
jgi:hypothetical protein